MKILQINNYYYIRGGSERYYFSISELLNEKGHKVFYFSVKDEKNYSSLFDSYFGDFISFDKDQNLMKKIKTAFHMLYSINNKRNIRKLVDKFRPDIAHAHNIYHRVCPSVLDELKKRKIPIVLTLHDYKLCCPIYTLYREEKVCIDCLLYGKYRVVRNNCTKKSRLLSLFHWVESAFHDFINIYGKNVSFFICPSLFSLRKHLECGLPEQKLVHIPNFVKVEKYDPKYDVGNYILYVGRLSAEKGIVNLLKAVNRLEIRLKVVGDGLLRNYCNIFVKENKINNVDFLGYKSGKDLEELFRNSAFIIIPSEWYENAPMTILEAFSYGKPVIGSKIGGIPEMIIDGQTGLLFKPGDYLELREKISYLINKPILIETMGKNARRKVEEEYNEEIHYKKILGVYMKTI